MKKIALAFAFAASAAAVQASFELVLAMDTVNNTIHRFDGITGSYMGQFGVTTGTWGTGTALALLQSRNEVVVAQGRFFSRFNYNTGQPITGVLKPAGVTSMSVSRDGQIIYGFGGTNVIRRWNANTMADLPSLTYTAGLQIFSGAEVKAGWLACQETSTGTTTIRLYNTASLVISPGYAIGGPTPGHMAVTNMADLSSWAGSDFTNMGVWTAAVNAAGIVGYTAANDVSMGYNPYPSGTLTNPFAAAGSHFGGYTGLLDAGVPAIRRTNAFMVQANTFGHGILGNCVSMATVIAPEPGVFVGLGIGVAALVARRRRG